MHKKSRNGFTLVELLVVLALMGVLAALTVGFFPNAANQQREAHAAQLLQGWLNIAKQRALRDQAPRGVRLLVTQTAVGGQTLVNVVTTAQYIEQPDDFSGGQVKSAPLPGDPPLQAGYTPTNTLAFIGADLLNGYSILDNPPSIQLWAVQPWQAYNAVTSAAQPNPTQWGPQVNQWQWIPGDFLELFGTGLMYKITNVGLPLPNYISIDPPLGAPLATPTTSYRVLRSPRAADTESLLLPTGTVIDIGTNKTYGNPLPWSNANAVTDYYIDILFSPSGGVISRGAVGANLNLWVRAPNENIPLNAYDGTPTIVSVSVATGFTGAYPVDRTPNQPYLQVGK